MGKALKGRRDEVLHKTAGRVERDLRDQPVVAAELLATLGNVYVDLGAYTNGVALLQKSIVLRKQVHGSEHSEIATSLSDLGQAFIYQGRSRRSRTLSAGGAGFAEKTAGTKPP